MCFKIWCQIGGGGTLFLKLHYSRHFSNIWVQKLYFFRVYGGVLKIHQFFQKFQKRYLQLKIEKSFNLNLSPVLLFFIEFRRKNSLFWFSLQTHNVPSVVQLTFTRPSTKREFDGMDGWMDGWDGMWLNGMGRNIKVSFYFLHTLWVYR